MKKFFVIVFCLFSVPNLWAVWEGNAGVGRVQDFEIGTMSVRSDLFPKNTFISIENLENGKKATALVIGTSGIPGLLVHVSPEVADSLSIASDRIVRVRIETTTRLGDDFLNEDGLYSSDADYNPNLALAQVTPSTDTNEYSENDTVLFDPASLKDYPKPKTPVEEPDSSTLPVTEVTEHDTNEQIKEPETHEPVEVKPIINSNEKVYLESTDLKPPVGQTTSNGSASSTPPTLAQGTTVPPSTSTLPSTSTQPSTSSTKPVSEVAGITEPKTSPSTSSTKPVSEVAGITEPKTSPSTSSTKPVSEVAGITEPKTSPSTSNTNPVSEVANITEPTPEEKPMPLQPIKQVDETSGNVQPKTVTTGNPDIVIVNEPVKSVVEASPVNEKVNDEPQYPIEPYTVTADATMYTGVLEKGKNYLQIAHYSNETNVKNVLSRYKQYPLVVVKTGSGAATRYRVFVGPLSRDEMGGTLEQFQIFGFKDAFFKVIQ